MFRRRFGKLPKKDDVFPQGSLRKYYAAHAQRDPILRSSLFMNVAAVAVSEMA